MRLIEIYTDFSGQQWRLVDLRLRARPIILTAESPHEVWYCVINFVFPNVPLYASYVHVASLILLPPSKMASLARTRLTGRLVSVLFVVISNIG